MTINKIESIPLNTYTSNTNDQSPQEPIGRFNHLDVAKESAGNTFETKNSTENEATSNNVSHTKRTIAPAHPKTKETPFTEEHIKTNTTDKIESNKHPTDLPIKKKPESIIPKKRPSKAVRLAREIMIGIAVGCLSLALLGGLAFLCYLQPALIIFTLIFIVAGIFAACGF